MTRPEFIAKAIHSAEKSLGIPAGWWGTWRHVQGPRGQEVRCTGQCWIVRYRGAVVSRHDVRSGAIGKARKLGMRKEG